MYVKWNSYSFCDKWLLFAFSGTLPYEYKIVIAGNHELTFDKEFMADLVKQDYYRFPSVSKLKPEDFDNVQSLITNSIYLQDSEVTVKGFRIYGAPWWVNTWWFDFLFFFIFFIRIGENYYLHFITQYV